MRVLIAGFKHETNTFASNLADWAAFERGEMFPKPVRGQAMLDMLATVDVSATGFARQARARGWTLVPSLWCGAVPSSYVTDDAFERICASILEDARKLDFDAIYLELHGAALTVSFDDAEGELLARIRAVVGPDIPIVASLDLHANVTRAMLELADGLVAFRTYPHIDYVKTGERAAELLDRLLRQGRREACASWRLPFLISINSQGTGSEPARSCYALLEDVDARYGTVSSFCMGFPASDFDECGPVLWAHGERAREAVAALQARVAEPSQWRLTAQTAPQAVARALQRAATSQGAVVIADTQDNPGIGGTSSTTGVLHALLDAGAGRTFPGRVALGVLYDPAAAALAHRAGVGQEIRCALGESVRTPAGASEPPVEGSFRVLALADGEATFKGPKMTGFRAQLGPTACLSIEGISIVVASGRIGAQDRELFRMVGVEPEAMKIIVVKSSHHFRADFDRLVDDPETDVLFALAPGLLLVDPADLPWKKLSPATRLRP
ncbi:microcystin degradation protein MlrC [Bordetella genomosp. 8]|uniref:Microcystinase C n=1 Tax=Bordetella genomosp. 8 TaxID=1416806 RepID=A0A1W6YGA6_9BORD|nr:M81 family metallopeptidase [Bordetella genomosp. 8]ARP80024.1 microcystin degradation protein MlrC [Bordetella genomosp. 8]